MPLYEYWCNTCKNKIEVFLRSFNTDILTCPVCKHDTLERRFSKFMVQKSYKDIYDSILSDSQLIKGMMNNDPRALVEWNKRMTGSEPVSPEYQETIERMEHGEMPPLYNNNNGNEINDINRGDSNAGI